MRPRAGGRARRDPAALARAGPDPAAPAGGHLTARRALGALGLALLAATCVVVAVRLWDTQVPAGLDLPELDPKTVFDARELERAESFEAFLRVLVILSQIVLVVVLALYAWRGARFAKESAAGRIGTGFLLGMLGLAILWLAQLPFGIVQLWWMRRHDVVEVGYVEYVIDSFFALGGEFLFLCLGLLIVMALAGVFRRVWWAPAAAAFIALFTLFAFVSPWLVPDLRKPRGPQLRAEAARLAKQQDLGDVPVRVEEVRDYTSQPNAYAFGMGPSRKVVLWDTIIDFPRPEVRSVLAHEFAHLSRHHIPKQIGWFALFIVPAALIVAVATRGRGGLFEAANVPLALFVLVLVSLLSTPLQSAASRRYEAEADWVALRTTNDPRAMERLHERFTDRALADPDPPGWFHVLFDSHPTGLQRIEMARAYAQQRAR